MCSQRAMLILAATSAAVAQMEPRCARPLQNSPADGNFASEVELKLEGTNKGLLIVGNDMGIQGHKTTLTQCSLPYTEAAGGFGWNWTRGTTEAKCSTYCPYGSCYYQFGFHKIQYGINPWGVDSGASKGTLPASTTNLESLNVNLDASYRWVDRKPVSKAPVYRSRFIFDFFLSNKMPVAKQMRPETITDEIVIDLAHNSDFQLPCGYIPGVNHSAVARDALIVNGEHYDVVDITDVDKPCPNCPQIRMTHFQRQGSVCDGKEGSMCAVPKEFDMLPFIRFAQKFKKESRHTPAGSWVGSIELGTEIYDNTEGSVMFTKFEVLPSSAPVAPPSPSPLPSPPAPSPPPAPMPKKSKCARPLKKSPADGTFAKQVELKLPEGLMLTGNDMGIQGHKTTLTQCSVESASGSFGWTWTRGTTEAKCSTYCPYGSCYYQFGFHKVQYGINPWGVDSGASKGILPASTTKLESLNVNLDASYRWVDRKRVSKAPVYRSRFIFDFFLSNKMPVAKQMRPETITDEIVIDLAHNSDFELPCGYIPGANHSAVARDALIVNGEHYDVVDITDVDKPCPNCPQIRMTHFQRQGSVCDGKEGSTCAVPKEFDMLPFIRFAQKFKKESRHTPAGSWVGSIELGTEIYDNTEGSVMFTKFEVLPQPLREKEVIVV